MKKLYCAAIVLLLSHAVNLAFAQSSTPIYATFQTVPLAASDPIPAIPSLVTLSAPASDWVIDMGTCPTSPCITAFNDPQIGTAVAFTFAALSEPPGASQGGQGDVSIGSLNLNSWGQWNFAGANQLLFYFRDHNNTSGLYRYVLIYDYEPDNQHCYREWLITYPGTNSNYALVTGQWYRISVALNSQPFLQGGNSSSCAKTENFNLNRIGYFEVGVFGPNVKGGSSYSFDIGSVVLSRSSTP